MTVTSAIDPAPPAGPGLRLLPAPPSAPPYDDERPGGQPLPLRPAGRAARPLRLVPPLAEASPAVPTRDLPALQPFAHALVQRLLEVLAGVRPVGQLQRDSSLEVYDEILAVLGKRPAPRGVRPDRRDVRSVHVQVVGDGVAEVNATVRRGGRYGALALRVEGHRGRWRCTQLLGL